MTEKCHQMALCVALHVICTTSELPTEEGHVLDSDVESGSFDFTHEVQDYFEEDVRQKRTAVEETKHKKQKGKGPRGKSSNGKGKSTNNSRGKIKSSDGNGNGKGKRKSSVGKGKGKRKSSKGKGKSTNNSKGKIKSSDGKGKGKSTNNSKGKRKSSDGKGKGKRKSSVRKGKGKGKRKPSVGKGKGKGKRKSSVGKGKGKRRSFVGKGKGKRKSTDGKGKRKPSVGKGKGKGKRQSSDGKGKGKKTFSDGKGKGKSNNNSKEKRKYSKLKGKQRTKSKRKRKNYKQHGKGRQTTSTQVNLTCLKDAVTYTKFLKDSVINFLRRNTRLTRQNSLTSNKGAKKGEFKEPAARLIQAGGGDKTNLSCSGSTTGNGAIKMKAVTDTLDDCELSIKNACKPPSSINTTTLDTCKTNAIAFNKTVSSCIVIATKGKDACSCFQAAEVLKEKKVLEKCKGSSEAQAAAAARTACLKVIQKCKNASSQAATLQYACSYSTAHLLKSLKQLTANSVAFKGLLDKIKELTGLSPSMGPASNSTSRRARSEEEKEEEAARLRGKRQVQACANITTTITTCTTTISNKPASTEVVEKCKTPTYTIGDCSTADKTAIQTALNDALDKNAIIIAFIASINAELKVITGTTPDPSSLGPIATAKVAARSRSVLRKMVLDKMNLRN